MSDRNAASGYMALKKETTKGVAVTPNVYTPYYSNDLLTDIHLMSDEPVYGNKFKRFQSLQGIRSHGGSVSVMAEPNSCALWHDMIATKSGTTGSDPYTHTFGASITTDPNSYTVDVAVSSHYVERFFGVEASKLTYGWEGEKMTLNLDVSGLGSFLGREIASISTTTIVLKTDYDPSPTTGLVASDLVRVIKADGSGSPLSTTISSITDGTTIVLGASAAAFAAGDMLLLRPATPSLSLLTPFTWPRTQFRFGADASAALAATQTRMEPGSEISLMHDFDDNEGSKRSGAFDPASLARTVYDLEVKLKKNFDEANQIKYFNSVAKRALVMRAYSGSTNQHELRVTLNNLRFAELPIPTESKGIVYEEITAVPNYDLTDTQGFDVKVINALATV